MAMKEYRNMKVYEQSGYHYKATPTIMLKGQWLKELGFDFNTKICVRCQDGKLTITRADEVETEYMEPAEMPVMCVAEETKVYGRKRR